MKLKYLIPEDYRENKTYKKIVRSLNYLTDEIRVVRERDPAASSKAEVLALYSGLHAILAYRLAHQLHIHGYKFPARLISQWAKLVTGIEIHPGAVIGKGVFIDHGTGVVIGETAVIGDNCTLYQGCTLGGTGKHTGKRHPTLGNNVMVGAGAKVLGPFKVGDNSKIAANAVVLNEVPPNSTAVGIPARIVRRDGKRIDGSCDLDQIHIPDPVAQELCQLRLKIDRLEKALEAENKDEGKKPKTRSAAKKTAAKDTAAEKPKRRTTKKTTENKEDEK
ncbi:MAG: serine O-acetyltransferase [Clostridia bacterium]|nr:serine O-acetyltransferase [Clostridia bacterium]